MVGPPATYLTEAVIVAIPGNWRRSAGGELADIDDDAA